MILFIRDDNSSLFILGLTGREPEQHTPAGAANKAAIFIIRLCGIKANKEERKNE